MLQSAQANAKGCEVGFYSVQICWPSNDRRSNIVAVSLNCNTKVVTRSQCTPSATTSSPRTNSTTLRPSPLTRYYFPVELGTRHRKDEDPAEASLVSCILPMIVLVQASPTGNQADQWPTRQVISQLNRRRQKTPSWLPRPKPHPPHPQASRNARASARPSPPPHHPQHPRRRKPRQSPGAWRKDRCTVPSIAPSLLPSQADLPPLSRRPYPCPVREPTGWIPRCLGLPPARHVCHVIPYAHGKERTEGKRRLGGGVEFRTTHLSTAHTRHNSSSTYTVTKKIDEIRRFRTCHELKI